MRNSHVVALALILVPTLASAQTMNAEAFHKSATSLQNKGPLAIFSGGQIKRLMNEGSAAYGKVAEQRRAALKAGTKPRFCPPAEPSKMGSNEFMSRLSRIPAAERGRIDMTEATNRILAVKFPCPV